MLKRNRVVNYIARKCTQKHYYFCAESARDKNPDYIYDLILHLASRFLAFVAFHAVMEVPVGHSLHSQEPGLEATDCCAFENPVFAKFPPCFTALHRLHSVRSGKFQLSHGTQFHEPGFWLTQCGTGRPESTRKRLAIPSPAGALHRLHASRSK